MSTTPADLAFDAFAVVGQAEPGGGDAEQDEADETDVAEQPAAPCHARGGRGRREALSGVQDGPAVQRLTTMGASPWRRAAVTRRGPRIPGWRARCERR